MYGIRSISRRIASPLPRIFKPLALAAMLSLTACAGGDIVFEGGSQANKSVDENSSGVVWTAKVQVKGALDSKDVLFSLSGADAALFTLNPTTGALSFKASPDFETPLDADKNNDYRIVITAAVKDKTAQQQISLNINNVTKPVVELIKPQLFENVGQGEAVDVEALVRFYDQESNMPMQAQVTINAKLLAPVDDDPTLWKGTISVPQGGEILSVKGSELQGKQTQTSLSAKVFNKPYSINPTYFTNINEQSFDMPTFMFGVDGQSDFFARYNFSTGKLTAHIWLSQEQQALNAELNFGEIVKLEHYKIAVRASDAQVWLLDKDRNSPQQSSILRQSDKGLNFTSILAPIGSFDFVFDEMAAKGFYLVGDGAQAVGQLTVVPIELSAHIVSSAEPEFKLPASVIKGAYKKFAVDFSSESYVFADERVIGGQLQTLIQCFNRAGEKRFAVVVGPDISNMVVHSAANVLYLAENSKHARAKLKVINLANGELKDLVSLPAQHEHGGFTSLGLDAARNRLLVGDFISDSIYVVDLLAGQLSQLEYEFRPEVNIIPPDEAVEN